MEDPQVDPLAVHCFCMCSGSVLLEDLLGVSRSRECDLPSVLSIYRRIFLCVFIVYRRVVRILCLLLYSVLYVDVCWLLWFRYHLLNIIELIYIEFRIVSSPGRRCFKMVVL